ncbi:MAG: protein kinase [Planctomycetales bacterium]|nr:protein kinase [Planctomycetales bacterium]
MKLLCPKCSSECDLTDSAQGSTICPSCGIVLFASASSRSRNGTTHIGRASQLQDASVAIALASDIAPQVRDRVSRDKSAAPQTGSWLLPESDQAPELALVPQFLGRFEVVDFLGSGAFSRVYLARDAQLDRLVALKVPRAERFDTKEAIASFVQEARVIAGLDHPGIVSIYDVGHDNGVQYIVMQYINGQTLQQRIAAGRLSSTEAAEIACRVAEAIHVAHKRQVFHRDIKPSNVLMDEDGRPHVVDFGLAVQERQQHRYTGEVAGTLAYMAPEQIRGEAQWLDGRSDVWSIGAMLYTLLTGRPPFIGVGPKISDEILNREPRPPRQIDERIPRELERICLKCLAKPVRDRYPTAFDLAEDLKNWLHKEASDKTPKQWTSTLEETVLAPAPLVRPKSAVVWIKWIALGFAGAAALGLAIFNAIRPKTKSDSPQPIAAALASVPTKPGEPRLDLTLKPNPFELDTYAVAGRWYSLLETKPQAYYMAPWDTARWSHDPQRQELLVNVPADIYLDLGQTESKSFTLEATIASTSWKGSVGFFWGRKEVGTELEEDGQLPQCHRLFLYCFKDQDGRSVNRLQRDRVAFKQFPGIKGFSPYNTMVMATVEVPLPDHRQQRLQLKVNGGVITVQWNSQEITGLNAVAMRTALPPLSAQGPFGIFASDGSFQISDVRIRLDER